MDPETMLPIPPGFRVYLGGPKDGSVEATVRPVETPEGYFYRDTLDAEVTTDKASYTVCFRVFTTKERWDFEREEIERLGFRHIAEWVSSAEKLLESWLHK
jgi:hypothetical protein